ncbi:MAG: integrase arm-type DNA-binding domain-containing protein [Blastomonas fulva]|uniref:tyrosine-type recombinase/integrase n=1 Tax=Blastomonas fulva TaxID=1550728 RepID=UPI0024E20121|nr:site-specific integrase [Blastomonas fulva]MDK2756434.1 integrase arm-type DNA-binding domain-containing protein [Blastomonas fulva]
MATGKITKRAVDAMLNKAQGSRADAFLWDTDVKGFGVKMTPAGKRVYILQYRLGGAGTKTRRYTIGTHGTWTPDAAEKEAKRLLMLVAQGKDPADDKRDRVRLATDLTFNAVADRFETLEVPKAWPKSGHFVKATLRLHLRPKLGKRPLPSITGRDLTALLDDIDGGQAMKRNVYAVAHRLFRWSKGRGEIDNNPLEGMEAPKPVASRDRVLDDRQLRLVWLASEDLGSTFCALIRLLMITGQRRDEVAAMDWSEVDRSRAEWLLPSARAKNGREHLVPLSPQAVALLDGLAGGEAWPGKGFVLTTDSGKSRVSGFSKAKRKLDGYIADLIEDDDAAVDAWRLHDLRRSAATGMQRLRIPGDWIEAVQNRRKAGVAGTYQRYAFADEKREALAAWGGHVAVLTAPKDNVVPLVRNA